MSKEGIQSDGLEKQTPLYHTHHKDFPVWLSMCCSHLTWNISLGFSKYSSFMICSWALQLLSVFWLFKALRKRCLKWASQNTREVPAPTTGYLVLSPARCGKNILFLWRAIKTDSLVAVKHLLRASEENPGESSVIRAGLKGNPGEQTENKTQSSFSLESLF